MPHVWVLPKLFAVTATLHHRWFMPYVCCASCITVLLSAVTVNVSIRLGRDCGRATAYLNVPCAKAADVLWRSCGWIPALAVRLLLNGFTVCRALPCRFSGIPRTTRYLRFGRVPRGCGGSGCAHYLPVLF